MVIKDKPGWHLRRRIRRPGALSHPALENQWQGCAPNTDLVKTRSPDRILEDLSILAYGQDVFGRFRAWWDGPGQTTDFSRKAQVYYGGAAALPDARDTYFFKPDIAHRERSAWLRMQWQPLLDKLGQAEG
jgi:hypothetical protein